MKKGWSHHAASSWKNAVQLTIQPKTLNKSHSWHLHRSPSKAYVKLSQFVSSKATRAQWWDKHDRIWCVFPTFQHSNFLSESEMFWQTKSQVKRNEYIRDIVPRVVGDLRWVGTAHSVENNVEDSSRGLLSTFAVRDLDTKFLKEVNMVREHFPLFISNALVLFLFVIFFPGTWLKLVLSFNLRIG